MAISITDAALLRLLQLGSAALPVGGFAYSQGLEYAVEAGWVKDAESCRDWLTLQLNHSLARTDLAVVSRLYRGCERNDRAALAYWNDYLLACRETRELRLTDTAMGQALARLLVALGQAAPDTGDTAFATAFCFAARQWRIESRACALAYVWAWLDNQVAAATKLVPLGQTQAQQLLGQLQAAVPAVLTLAASLGDEDIGASLPAVALASSRHETQYTRLFRS